MGFEKFIPKQLKNTNKNKSEQNKNEQNVIQGTKKKRSLEDIWEFTDTIPTKNEIKAMWAEAVVFGVRLLMENHVYKFDNKIKLQKDGGSTGVTLTGVLSEIKMTKWCKVFRDTIKNIGIKCKLEKRFVDDITLLLKKLKPGTRLVENSLVHYDEKVDEDKTIADDERTMIIVQTIANNIDKNIKVTYDVPSRYPDQKVPILDVKAGVNCENNKIEYIFFKKPMASRHVTNKNTAMSVNQKFNIITQQCFTRIHNTSENIKSEVKVQALNDFMEDMKISGYNESDCLKVLKGAINTHKKLKEKEYKGERPYFRDSDFMKTQRKSEKTKKKYNWFRGENDNFKSVMFVDPTPGDTLIKMLRQTENTHRIADNMRIKFVSKSGSKLIHKFQKRDPFKGACGRHDCQPCASSNDNNSEISNCRSNNVTYSAQCVECEKGGKIRMYIGETSRNLYVRSCEHYSALRNQNATSFMNKHITAEHANNKENVSFKWKVMRKFNKPLQRQLYEAKTISDMPTNVILNTKQEFNNLNIKNLYMQNKQKQVQCNLCGSKFINENCVNTHKDDMHTKISCQNCDYDAIGKIDLKYHKKYYHTDVK